jgi:hypothetical protein
VSLQSDNRIKRYEEGDKSVRKKKENRVLAPAAVVKRVRSALLVLSCASKSNTWGSKNDKGEQS